MKNINDSDWDWDWDDLDSSEYEDYYMEAPNDGELYDHQINYSLKYYYEYSNRLLTEDDSF
tara:strand:- start:121 stop:303 length:183 start_codon:yes stop_codon:yes gene_type:complete